MARQTRLPAITRLFGASTAGGFVLTMWACGTRLPRWLLHRWRHGSRNHVRDGSVQIDTEVRWTELASFSDWKLLIFAVVSVVTGCSLGSKLRPPLKCRAFRLGMNPRRKMRTALYARVSTLNGQNPEMQLSELREYAS